MLWNLAISLEKLECLLCSQVYRQHLKSVAGIEVSFQRKILQLDDDFLLLLHSKGETDLEKPLKVIL